MNTWISKLWGFAVTYSVTVAWALAAVKEGGQHVQRAIKMNFGWALLPGQSLEEEQGLGVKVIQSLPPRQCQAGLPSTGLFAAQGPVGVSFCSPSSLPAQRLRDGTAPRSPPPPPPTLFPNGLDCVARCSHPSQKVKKRSRNLSESHVVSQLS